MNLIDFIIIGALLFFAIRGYIKGLVNEIFGLMIIIFGFLISLLFYRPFSQVVEIYIRNRDLSLIVAFLLLFIAVTVVLIVIRNTILRLVEKFNISEIDEILGVVVGVFKGLLLLTPLLIFLEHHSFRGLGTQISKSFIFPHLKGIFSAIVLLLPLKIQLFLHSVL